MTWTKKSVSPTTDTGKVRIGGSGMDVRKPARVTAKPGKADPGAVETHAGAETIDTGKVKIGGSGIDLRKPRR